jgi:hypothetical protein
MWGGFRPAQLPEQKGIRVVRFKILLGAGRADAVARVEVDAQQDGLAGGRRNLVETTDIPRPLASVNSSSFQGREAGASL